MRFGVCWRIAEAEATPARFPVIEPAHFWIGVCNAVEVEWSVRYLPDFRLPDKALDLVDHACAAARFRTLTPQEKKSRGETPQATTLLRDAAITLSCA